MSLPLEVVRDKPRGFWMMDDSSPFQDYSGYSRAATQSGTQTTHVPLAQGAAYSTQVSNSAPASFDSPVFIQGREKDEFTIEAFVRPIQKSSAADEQQILGNSGIMDGLTINHTVVSFVTKYLTADEARVSYDIQQLRSVHVRGVHTEDKNSLYINGTLVGEVAITEEQKADSFEATDGLLYSGASTSDWRLALQGVATFSTALSNESAVRHAGIGRNVVAPEDVAFSFGGARIPLSYNKNDVFLDQQWESDNDWAGGLLLGTVSQQNKLLPQFYGGNSVSGQWINLFPIGTSGLTSIYGVNVTWDGEGPTVEATLDGINWVPVIRGKNISLLPPGTDPTDMVLALRVRFAGGVYNDSSYMDNLHVVGLSTGTVPSVHGRTVSVSGDTSVKNDRQVVDLYDNWGTELEGGTVTIGTSNESEPINPRTIELWIKRTSTATLSTNVTGTIYKSGVSGTLSASTPLGEWSLVHIVTAAPVTGTITFTGHAEIGQVVLYEEALTTAQMTAIQNSYMGRPTTRIGDNSLVSIAESPTAANMFAHDWSILSAG